tara:strand:- start:1656 stop:2249 length:594 start_codon:yes stop_codon:yes gene_type:complete
MKICGNCKKTLPKNKDNFFGRKIKEVNSKGETKIYNSFRSVCKKCHTIKTRDRARKKRCEEMNCNISDYEKNWKKQQRKTSSKDFVAMENLTKYQYDNYIRFLKKGEVSDYKSYLKRIKKSKEQRNYRVLASVLDRMKYFTIQDKKEALKMYAKNEMLRVTDSYVANVVMKTPIKELSPEIIETKRLIIKIKRELNK